MRYIKKNSILRKIRSSDDRYEVSPTLKLLFSAEEIQSLTQIYRGLSERVESAIKKLDEGTYGQCHECGKEVPKEKLELEAWAEHCSADCIKVHNQNE